MWALILSNMTLLFPMRAMCFTRGYIDTKEFYVLSTGLFLHKKGFVLPIGYVDAKEHYVQPTEHYVKHT